MRHEIPRLAELTPSILAALGVPDASNSLDLRPVPRACVLLVDGLGWELLGAHPQDAPVLTELAAGAGPLRVGLPATTSAGLAAIGTGVSAGEHGMVGYSFALPEVGLLNALGWCRHGEQDRADLRELAVPEQVQPRQTVFQLAAESGIAASVVSAAAFADSGMTRASLRGGDYRGVHAIGDLIAATEEALRPRPSFCFAYHADLDRMGHLHGPGSLAWRMQLRQVDRLVEGLLENLPTGTLLTVVADHGMVQLGPDSLDVDSTEELWPGVRAVGGEVRLRHVYTEAGAREDVLASWRSVLGARAEVCERDDAVERGWFGPRVDASTTARIGDVVAVPRGDFGLLRGSAEPFESRLVGHHGALTDAEQLVPLVCAYR